VHLLIDTDLENCKIAWSFRCDIRSPAWVELSSSLSGTDPAPATAGWAFVTIETDGKPGSANSLVANRARTQRATELRQRKRGAKPTFGRGIAASVSAVWRQS
jgi:hypothetical protein